MSDHAAPDTHTGAHDALAVGWALHTLDRDEETAFAAHLETCPACRRTVDETLETLGAVAEAVVPVDPPPALRRRLLDAVQAEAAPAPPADATVVPLAPRRRRATRWLAAAAAVLVVAAIGGLTAANQSLRDERDAAQATATAQAEREAAITDVLRDAGTPGVPHAVLANPQGALVGVVVDDGANSRVLSTGLAANAGDETYVLWGLADGTPRALGTFDVGGQGPDVLSVPSSAGAVPYAGFAVSLEPGRTAPASPTQIVASGQVGR